MDVPHSNREHSIKSFQTFAFRGLSHWIVQISLVLFLTHLEYLFAVTSVYATLMTCRSAVMLANFFVFGAWQAVQVRTRNKRQFFEYTESMITAHCVFWHMIRSSHNVDGRNKWRLQYFRIYSTTNPAPMLLCAQLIGKICNRIRNTQYGTSSSQHCC